MLLHQAVEIIQEVLLNKKKYTHLILVGYSLGGYLAATLLKYATSLQSHIKGALLIAPLLDFPLIILPTLKIEKAMEFHQNGKVEVVDEESGFTLSLTKEALESCQKFAIVNCQSQLELNCPVWTVWGNRDKVCPPAGAGKLKSKVKGDDLESLFHIAILPMCGHKMDRITDETLVGMHYDDLMKVLD